MHFFSSSFNSDNHTPDGVCLFIYLIRIQFHFTRNVATKPSHAANELYFIFRLNKLDGKCGDFIWSGVCAAHSESQRFIE